MILIGYDDKSKAYRCYNPLTQKVVVSRDVKFPVEEKISEINTRVKSLDAESTDELNQDSTNQNEKDHSNDEDLDEAIYYSDHSDDESTNIASGKPPKRLINEINLAHNEIKEPKSYNDAMNNPFKNQWIAAMQEEMTSLENNQTWKLSELPNDRQLDVNGFIK